MLVEFSTEDSLKEILQSCSSHQKNVDIMSLKSPFLWFRAVPGKKECYVPSTDTLLLKEGTVDADEDALFEELIACKSISEQIQLLYDRTVLNDLGVRLRYMVARQVSFLI